MEYDIRLKKTGILWHWFVLDRKDEWAHKSQYPQLHCLSRGWAFSEERAKHKATRRTLVMKETAARHTGHNDYIVTVDDAAYEVEFTKLRDKLKKES